MKKHRINYLSVIVILLFSLHSCSSIKSLDNGKKIDKKLVGSWQGSENDKQVKDLKKEWEMTRNDDGTFVLNFTTISHGKTDTSTEYGNWWVEGNHFFEYHQYSDKTDTYKYTVLNKNQVQFEMLNSEIKFDDSNYIFIDTRVSKSKKSTKDGLSIDNAIKVNSVAKEYEYIRKNCNNCKLIMQSLMRYKGKPYDKISLKTIDGKEISYYFDISSFYGKW